MYSHKLPCLSSLLTIINFYDWLSIKKFVRYSCSSIMIVWRNFCKCRGHTFLNSCKLQIEKKSRVFFNLLYSSMGFWRRMKERRTVFCTKSALLWHSPFRRHTEKERKPTQHNEIQLQNSDLIFCLCKVCNSLFCKELKLCNPLLTLLFLSSGDSS